MGLPDISAALWRERNLLEMLLFRLDEVQLLLAHGDSRWLGQATGEVEAVLKEIRMTEVLRACLVEAQAPSLGLGPNASLRSLALEAPSPWNELLAEHRIAFLALTDEISAVVQTNQELWTQCDFATRGLVDGPARQHGGIQRRETVVGCTLMVDR